MFFWSFPGENPRDHLGQAQRGEDFGLKDIFGPGTRTYRGTSCIVAESLRWIGTWSVVASFWVAGGPTEPFGLQSEQHLAKESRLFCCQC